MCNGSSGDGQPSFCAACPLQNIRWGQVSGSLLSSSSEPFALPSSKSRKKESLIDPDFAHGCFLLAAPLGGAGKNFRGKGMEQPLLPALANMSVFYASAAALFEHRLTVSLAQALCSAGVPLASIDVRPLVSLCSYSVLRSRYTNRQERERKGGGQGDYRFCLPFIPRCPKLTRGAGIHKTTLLRRL